LEVLMMEVMCFCWIENRVDWIVIMGERGWIKYIKIVIGSRINIVFLLVCKYEYYNYINENIENWYE
jgi:hypothetical protein